jgi:hypothetical protein
MTPCTYDHFPYALKIEARLARRNLEACQDMKSTQSLGGMSQNLSLELKGVQSVKYIFDLFRPFA